MEKKNVVYRLLYYSGRDIDFISNVQISEFLQKEKIDYRSAEFQEICKVFEDRKLSRFVLKTYSQTYEESPKPVHDKIEEIPHLREFMEILTIRRYSPKTIKNYRTSLQMTQDWSKKILNKSLDVLETEDLHNFFLYLVRDKKSSPSTLRIYRFALELYYRMVLNRDMDFSIFKSIRKDTHIPTVLTHAEIKKILNQILNIKHKAMVSLLYSSGLRVSEAVKLKVKDISF